LKAEGSRRTVGLALLVIGLAIGAGLVFTLNYAFDVLTPHTVTSVFVITVPTTITSTAVYAQIQATVTSCQWTGSHEYCEIVLENPGDLVTATTGNCSLSYGGHTYTGYTGPTLGSAASPGAAQQLIAGGKATAYCQASSGEPAGAGEQVIGAIPLTDRGEAVFSAGASS